jgi:hypothetical protein
LVVEALRTGDDVVLRWYLNNASSIFYDVVEEVAGFGGPARANGLVLLR